MYNADATKLFASMLRCQADVRPLSRKPRSFIVRLISVNTPKNKLQGGPFCAYVRRSQPIRCPELHDFAGRLRIPTTS